MGRIATGEIEDIATAGADAQRESCQRGCAAITAALTPEQRAEIAKKAAAKRVG
jgi:hypothetical protein